jgi:hypothetical protein
MKHFTMRRVGLTLLATALVCLSQAAAASAGGGNSANAHLCQHGGWQTLSRSGGSSFTSVGDCVSYAAQGGTLQGAYPQTAAICVHFGGTFGVGGPDLVQAGAPGAGVIWVCNGVPGGAPSVTEIEVLAPQCTADTNGRGELAVLAGAREGSPSDMTCYSR